MSFLQILTNSADIITGRRETRRETDIDVGFEAPGGGIQAPGGTTEHYADYGRKTGPRF